VTVALSALVLSHVRITPRLVAGTLLTVCGVVLVLAG
jgi:drug/metabolite transporter (DMT)-like permease